MPQYQSQIDLLNELIANNPKLASMDDKKRAFLLDFANQEMPQTSKEAMPILFSYINRARRSSIQFSKEEIDLLCELLIQNMDSNNKEKARQLLALVK